MDRLARRALRPPAHPQRQRRPGARDDVARGGRMGRDFVRARRAARPSSSTGTGQPLAIGEIRASSDARRRADGARLRALRRPAAGAARALGERPVRAESRDDGSSRRGVADDKGQLYMLLDGARRSSPREGALPVNVRVACDGEEEIGGHSIVDFLERTSAAPTRAIIFDARHAERGRAGVLHRDARARLLPRRRARRGERDLHSGMYGGAALNATHALMQDARRRRRRATAGCPSRCGRASSRRPTEELAGWASCRPARRSSPAQGARPADARAAEEFYLRTFAEPARRRQRHRRRLAAAPEDRAPGAWRRRTCRSASRRGRTSTRSRPRSCGSCARRRRRAPRSRSSSGRRRRPGSSARTRRRSSSASTRSSARSARGRCCSRARRHAADRAGAGRRGIPTIVTGFALPESNIHSPNERLLVEHVPLGIAAARELLLALAELALRVRVIRVAGRASRGRTGASRRSPAAAPRPFGVSSYSTRGGVSG